MINNTTLVGRLTKDPELKFTTNSIAVMSFTLAVERSFKNAQGERETDFINCVAWRGTAETLSKFAAKGSLVGIIGSIQTRNYQDNEGRTIYMTEVLVDKFQILEPKSVTDERRGQASGQTSNNYSNANQAQKSNKNPFENMSDNNAFENLDDDYPF